MIGISRAAWFFASGDAFFLAAALLASAGFIHLASLPAAGILKRAAILLGVALIIPSAAPLSLWLWVVWALAAARLFFARQPTSPDERRWAWLAAAPLILASVASAAVEIPWHVTPRLGPGERERLIVIGDSITAGIGDGAVTWPRLLMREEGLDVWDTSVPGLSAADAHTVVQGVPERAFAGAVVVIAIGGNDMLTDRAPAADFEESLDRLLELVSARAAAGASQDVETRIVMLELPLAPFFNAYGRIQRHLAGKYDALLIPKRRPAKIFRTPRATIDGLHLSQEGHELMAQMIFEVIGEGFKGSNH